jgi:hypothetical protein
MKTRSIFFALAISSCSAVPAFAQNAIVSASIDPTPLSLNGVNYPAVTITPGTTANSSTIAVGNITPLQYRGALGFTNDPPECILQQPACGNGADSGDTADGRTSPDSALTCHYRLAASPQGDGA